MNAQPVPVWVRRTGVVAVALVAAVAAVVSFDHMRALAEEAGEGWKSWLLPFSVDGMLVSASLVMLARRRAGQPVGALAWVSLVLGLAVSLVANVAAAQPTLVGRLVAAWPPLAFGLSYELLLSLVRRAEPTAPQTVGQREPDPQPTEEPIGQEEPADLVDRARELVAAGHAEGRPVGRGRLASALDIPESQARRLLDQLTSQDVRPVLHAVHEG